MNRIVMLLLIFNTAHSFANECKTASSLENLGVSRVVECACLTTLALKSLTIPTQEKVRDGLIGLCRNHFRSPQVSLQVHAGGINDLVINEAGIIFSVGEDGYIKQIEATTCESVKTTNFYNPEHKGQALLSLAVGNRIVATGGADHMIKLWNVDSKKLYHPKLAHAGTVDHVALLKDGAHLASAATNSIKLWDVATGKQISDHKGHGNPATVIASNGSVLVTSGWDGRCCVYSLEQQQPTHTKDELDSVRVVTVDKQGTKVALGNLSGLVRVWDLVTDTLEDVVQYNVPITSLSFNDKGTQLLVNAGTKPIGLYDVQSGQELGAIAEHSQFAKSAVIDSLNQRVVVATGTGAIELWQIPDYKAGTLDQVMRKATVLGALSKKE